MTLPQRETRTFTTPAGHVVELNAYLTGREAQELKTILFAALKVDMNDAQSGKVNVNEVPSSFLVEQEKKAMQFLIVSLDGETNAPIDKLMELPSSEYDAVLQELNKIQNPTGPQR